MQPKSRDKKTTQRNFTNAICDDAKGLCMTRIFVFEKYAIARDALPFEKDAQAQDATLF